MKVIETQCKKTESRIKLAGAKAETTFCQTKL